ncbi:MAG: DNA repair protein RecO [Halioglobus sp.]
MINERVSLQPAYVLHTRPYRDTSALLEVFTAEHGRLSLIAKGARRSGKKGGGSSLQPFQPLLVSFSGRADLKTLTGNETAGEAAVLRGDRLYSGLYLNELLMRLLHRYDPHPQLFAAYGDALVALATDAALDPSLRRFELVLLDELGYRLVFDVCGLSHAPVQAEACYRFDPELGLVSCAQDQYKSSGIYSGTQLQAMAAGDFSGEARHAAKRLLREALAVHLGDKPLNSRSLFRHSAAQSGAVPERPQPDGVQG